MRSLVANTARDAGKGAYASTQCVVSDKLNVRMTAITASKYSAIMDVNSSTSQASRLAKRKIAYRQESVVSQKEDSV